MSGKYRNILHRNCVLVCFCKAVGNSFAVVETTKVEIVGMANTAERKAADTDKAAERKVADKDKAAERKAADKDKAAERKVVDMAECIADTVENTNKAERRSRFGIN